MADVVPIGTPKPSGGRIPEPFNENNVTDWIGRILKTLCREERRCFYPSEFILDEEIQQAKAYDNPVEKERALSEEGNFYHKLAKFCLEELTNKLVVTRDSRTDSSDNREYIVYCKTPFLVNRLCQDIDKIGLPGIDKILEDYTAAQSLPKDLK
jgi:hypothetical protein